MSYVTGVIRPAFKEIKTYSALGQNKNIAKNSIGSQEKSQTHTYTHTHA